MEWWENGTLDPGLTGVKANQWYDVITQFPTGFDPVLKVPLKTGAEIRGYKVEPWPQVCEDKKGLFVREYDKPRSNRNRTLYFAWRVRAHKDCEDICRAKKLPIFQISFGRQILKFGNPKAKPPIPDSFTMEPAPGQWNDADSTYPTAGLQAQLGPDYGNVYGPSQKYFE